MIYKSACKYFGLEPKFDVEDFLPAPSVPQLKPNLDVGNEQSVLLDAVQKVYRIDQDDVRLRRLLDKPAGKRGEYFDSLRKNYPVRREFQNTKIILATEDAEGTEENSKRLLDKLEGIGFGVQHEKDG
jgi:erythronate-4-phosphate dehydrogenase